MFHMLLRTTARATAHCKKLGCRSVFVDVSGARTTLHLAINTHPLDPTGGSSLPCRRSGARDQIYWFCSLLIVAWR